MTGLIGAGGIVWLALTLLLVGLVLGMIVGLLLLLSVARRRRRRRRRPPRPSAQGPAGPNPPADVIVFEDRPLRVAASLRPQEREFSTLPRASARPLTAEAIDDEALVVSPLRFGEIALVERELLRAVELLHDEPRDEFNALIDQLKTHADEAATAVVSIEKRLDESGENLHSLRWSLYYVLAEVALPDITPVLVEKAIAELPGDPEDAESDACEGLSDDAALVSVMAVEGIQRLLEDDAGRERAADALRHIIDNQPHPAVRRAAARALLADPRHREAFLSGIPPDLMELVQASQLSPAEIAAKLTINPSAGRLPPP